MGECFAHGRFIGCGMCPKCKELGRKGELLGYKKRNKVPYRYDEKGCCRWCGTKVKPPRRSWCSQECVDDYMVRNDPQLARAKVETRDRWVCAMCRMDTKVLRDRIRLLYQSAMAMRSTWHRPEGEATGAERDGLRCASLYRYNEAAQLLREHGIDVPNLGLRDPFVRAHRLVTGAGPLWEMDHTVPVTDGGAGCGLENLRTLCLPCHRKETARLAAYRAQKRAEEAAAEQERIAPRLPYID